MEYAREGHVCLLPKEKVICENEVKSISDIDVGEKVLTDKARFRNVTKKYVKMYNGNIKIVKTKKFNLNLKTTEEHPFLVAKPHIKIHYEKLSKNSISRSSYTKEDDTKIVTNKTYGMTLNCGIEKYSSRCCSGRWQRIKNIVEIYYDYIWKKAKELDETDFLVYPIMNDKKENDVLDKKICIYCKSKNLHGHGKTPNGNKRFVCANCHKSFVEKYLNCNEMSDLSNENLCYILGLYFADGTSHIKAGKIRFFVDDRYKDKICKKIEKVFKIKPKIYKLDGTEKCLDIAIHSRKLARIFNKYGVNENKKPPFEILSMPSECRDAFLEGYLDGDGTINKSNKGRYHNFSTISPSILFIVTQILLKKGIIPSISLNKRKKYGEPTNLKGFSYFGAFGENFNLVGNIDKNYLLLPVKKVITEKYYGLVYNLEVEEDNTYTTLNSIVHNCLDEFWTVVDARSSASSKNKIVGNMLLKSRKRDLTIMFTSQMLDLLDKRVRKIMDFTAYCLLNQHETLGKVFIFRSGYPKDHMLLKQFLYRTPMIWECYNSITGDQDIFYMNDDTLHIEKAEEFVPEIHKKVFVPCLNTKNYKMEIKPAKAFLSHRVKKDGYEIKTQYGRKVKVTGDHSLLSYNNGKIENIPARKLKVGDLLCIPKNVPIKEKDVKEIDTAKKIYKKMNSLKKKCDFSLLAKVDRKFLEKNYEEIKRKMKEKHGNYAYVRLNLCNKKNYIPYYILEAINKYPEKFYITSRYLKNEIPNKIKIDKDLLWLLGFFVAEGSTSNNYDLRFGSEDIHLKKAKYLMKKIFNVDMCYTKKTEGRCPSISCSIRSLSLLFDELTEDLSWIVQLPKNKLKYFLKGWFDGDGYHNGNPENFVITTANDKLVNPLLLILHKFGLLPCVNTYDTTTKIRDKNYQSHSNVIRVCGIKKHDIKNILNWDKGIKQKIRAKIIGDIAIVKIKGIKPIVIDDFVYDFSVEKNENFIAGNLLCCKNTNEEINMGDDDGKPPLIVFQESPDVPPKYFDTWEDCDKFGEAWWEKNGKDLLPLMMEIDERKGS